METPIYSFEPTPSPSKFEEGAIYQGNQSHQHIRIVKINPRTIVFAHFDAKNPKRCSGITYRKSIQRDCDGNEYVVDSHGCTFYSYNRFTSLYHYEYVIDIGYVVIDKDGNVAQCFKKEQDARDFVKDNEIR